VEILDIIHGLFNHCHQEDKERQADRFAWLKERIINLKNEVECLCNAPPVDELDEIDCAEDDGQQPTSSTIEQDPNGEELDYHEDDAVPFSRRSHSNDSSIKSPPPEEDIDLDEGDLVDAEC